VEEAAGAFIRTVSNDRRGQGALLSKAKAGYRELDHSRPCMLCGHFDGYRGACAVVAGAVRPIATCDHWASVDDQAPERPGFV